VGLNIGAASDQKGIHRDGPFGDRSAGDESNPGAADERTRHGRHDLDLVDVLTDLSIDFGKYFQGANDIEHLTSGESQNCDAH
jgi:hypothetical protein